MAYNAFLERTVCTSSVSDTTCTDSYLRPERVVTDVGAGASSRERFRAPINAARAGVKERKRVSLLRLRRRTSEARYYGSPRVHRKLSARGPGDCAD